MEIRRDWITKIALENWAKTEDFKPQQEFSAELVKEIWRKSVPLQRVMILEVSHYLEKLPLVEF